ELRLGGGSSPGMADGVVPAVRAGIVEREPDAAHGAHPAARRPRCRSDLRDLVRHRAAPAHTLLGHRLVPPSSKLTRESSGPGTGAERYKRILRTLSSPSGRRFPGSCRGNGTGRADEERRRTPDANATVGPR